MRDSLPSNMRHPLLVKIAPDLSEYDKEDIASVVTRPKVRFSSFLNLQGENAQSKILL